jgi:hypothetical protein
MSNSGAMFDGPKSAFLAMFVDVAARGWRRLGGAATAQARWVTKIGQRFPPH